MTEDALRELNDSIVDFRFMSAYRCLSELIDTFGDDVILLAVLQLAKDYALLDAKTASHGDSLSLLTESESDT